VVAVLLNLSALTPLASAITLQGCGGVASARALTYTGGGTGFSQMPASSKGDVVELSAAPYSITVIDIATEPAKSTAAPAPPREPARRP
jgi:hypothetical protein